MFLQLTHAELDGVSTHFSLRNWRPLPLSPFVGSEVASIVSADPQVPIEISAGIISSLTDERRYEQLEAQGRAFVGQ